MEEPQTLVTVGTFTSPVEAHLAKGRLQVEGIQAIVLNEHHISVNWPMSQALGGVKVQVPAEQLEAAKKVLEALARGEYAEPDALETKCPICGSNNIKARFSLPKLLFLIVSLGLSAIFPIRREKLICRRCAHKWSS